MEEPRKVTHWHDHFNVSERICFSCIFLHVWYFVIKSAKFTSCLLCFKSRCHGVGEGHHTALGVSQPGVKVKQTHLPGYVYGVNSQLQWPAIVQELQENVEDVRMRLFHLISPADFVNWPCHSPNCLTMCLIKEYQGVWPPSNSLKGFQR